MHARSTLQLKYHHYFMKSFSYSQASKQLRANMTIPSLPTPAAVLDANVDVGGKTTSDVKVDNSDHNMVTGSINLEQTMGTIFFVFAILLGLYCCKYGFRSVCRTAKTHFGRRQDQDIPLWYSNPPQRPQPQRQQQEEPIYAEPHLNNSNRTSNHVDPSTTQGKPSQ